MKERRVGVTGIGIVSPIGIGAAQFWRSVAEGRSGIRSIRAFDAAAFPTRIAGEIENGLVDPIPFLKSRKATKTMSQSAVFALVAAGEAARHAGLPLPASDPSRVGVVMGSDVKQWGFDEIVEFEVASRRDGAATSEARWQRFSRLAAERMNPFNFLKNMPNMDAAHISIAFEARGPGSTVTSGCTAGLQAVGEAFAIIQRGEADAVFAGATNAFATPMEIVHLSLQGWLTHRNDDPSRAVRSFDVTRDGFAPGEGAAILLLEDLTTARRRGTRVLAEIRAVAARSGGPWLPADVAETCEAEDSLAAALTSAGVAPRDLNMVHAFGTATRAHDRWECASLCRALTGAAERVPVTSIRPLIGVCGAASGAFDLAATVLSMVHGAVPPIATLCTPDPDCPMAFVRGEPLAGSLLWAATHVVGLDGQSAAAVVAAPAE
jgi:3-oxoacyl-(acyl-carrier-protein) synthase